MASCHTSLPGWRDPLLHTFVPSMRPIRTTPVRAGGGSLPKQPPAALASQVQRPPDRDDQIDKCGGGIHTNSTAPMTTLTDATDVTVCQCHARHTVGPRSQIHPTSTIRPAFLCPRHLTTRLQRARKLPEAPSRTEKKLAKNLYRGSTGVEDLYFVLYL